MARQTKQSADATPLDLTWLVSKHKEVAIDLALSFAKANDWGRFLGMLESGMAGMGPQKSRLQKAFWSAPEAVIIDFIARLPKEAEMLSSVRAKTTVGFPVYWAAERESPALLAAALALPGGLASINGVKNGDIGRIKTSPLSKSLLSGRWEMARTLMKAGSKVNNANETLSPLTCAILSKKHGSSAMVEELLLAGADAVTERHFHYGLASGVHDGFDSMDFSCQRINPLAATALVGDKRAAKALMAAGADPWACYSGYPEDLHMIPAWCATMKDNREMAELFVKGGGDWKVRFMDRTRDEYYKSLLEDGDRYSSYKHDAFGSKLPGLSIASSGQGFFASLRMGNEGAWLPTLLLDAALRAKAMECSALWIGEGADVDGLRSVLSGKSVGKAQAESLAILDAAVLRASIKGGKAVSGRRHRAVSV